MNQNNVKIIKRSHAYRDYASTYNVEILNYFITERQIKDSESAIKNKSKKLLTEIRGFKFVTTSILKFKKIENNVETKFIIFILTQKQKQLLMKVILMIYLNQFVLQLSKYKNILEKVLVGLLIQL